MVYDSTNLKKSIGDFKKIVIDAMEFIGEIPEDVILNSTIFDAIPTYIIFPSNLTQSSETFDPSTGILDLEDLLVLWNDAIIAEFERNNSTYIQFVNDKSSLFNDILLKCIAAEKTADLPVVDMDAILQLRVSLLKAKLVTNDNILYDLNKLDAINQLNTILASDINQFKNNKLSNKVKYDKLSDDEKLLWVTEEFKSFIDILSERLPHICSILIDYIQNNFIYMNTNRDNVNKIDDKLAEIVKIVTLSSIMVSASGNKKNIILSNYNNDSIEYLTATTFMGLQKNRTDVELGITMKETVKIITSKKEYIEFFNSLIDYYKNIL